MLEEVSFSIYDEYNVCAIQVESNDEKMPPSDEMR